MSALSFSLINAGYIIYENKYEAYVKNELSAKGETYFSGLIYDEHNSLNYAFVQTLAEQDSSTAL